MPDAPLRVRPKCGGTVERLITAGSGVILKGPGFHATDYHGAQPACGEDAPCLRKPGHAEQTPEFAFQPWERT